MVADNEIDEDELEENELPFFKCNDCGSRVLHVCYTVEITTTTESVLPCKCGNEEEAAYRTTELTEEQRQTGYVTPDRHFCIDEVEDTDELDRNQEDEIICEKCCKKYKDQDHLWQAGSPVVVEDHEGADLTITCDGCDREIEFGYSHPDKQDRIFLGEDDSDFEPKKTFPDPKYFDKWKERGWLRSTEEE